MALEDEIYSDPSSNDSFEPVSPEFHGKEAIRYRKNYLEMQMKHLSEERELSGKTQI